MQINITLEDALKKASPQLREKMQYSVDLLRKAEPLALRYSPDGFYCAVSFGKDSQALYHMAQLAGVRMTAHFSPTSVDPPEVIRFGRKYYPEVKFNKLTKSIYTTFIERKWLPSMKIRWCCAEFKEKGGEGRVTIVGVRNAESVKRSKRREVEVTSRKFSGNLEQFGQWSESRIAKKMKAQEKDMNFDQFSEHKEQMVTCVGGKDKIVVSPIIHWTESDVWEFLNNVVEVPHCELYDEGWTRIGCICCPMASKKSIVRDIKRWPHVKEKWIKAIMEIRRQGMQDCQCADNQEITPPHRPNIYQLPRRGRAIPQSRSLYDNDGFVRGAISLDKTEPRDLDRKFLNSVVRNGESVNAESNITEEQIAREVAEAIFDWWISRKSYKQWFADKYLQGSFDIFDEES